jgi:LuxR family maltose regulon positive regulatory protein
VRARIWIANGDLDKAADWLADRGLATADQPRYLTEYEHLTMVRLLLEQRPGSDAYDQAVQLLTRLEEAAESSGRKGSLAEIRMLLARAAAVSAEGQTQAPLSAGGLTGRELEVLRLLDSDLTAPQIAKQLFVSHNTLRTHTKHIFTKLDVTTRRAAVARGRERGLL